MGIGTTGILQELIPLKLVMQMEKKTGIGSGGEKTA